MKKKIQNYISDWEKKCYSDGIPDDVPVRIRQLNKAPSYEAIAIAILKNDTSLESIGFSRKKTAVYSELKRIELTIRGKIKQLKLDL